MEDMKNTESVHLLLVEDNPRFLEELLEWLQDFNYQHIETAVSVAQAQEKLAEPFDIIIADMRMEQDDSGFAVIDEVKRRNLSSVVIILTANDTVADCRRAFKMGAWDYISKNMRGNVFDALHASIQEAITYFNRWGNLQNEQWIQEHTEVLERDYFGQYIAVMNQAVVDAAETIEALEKQIEERKLRRFLLTIRKIGDFRPIAELIKLPESSNLEFKSTWQWDVKRNCPNKELRFNCLKTITAFLNSEGGTLLIGVEDDSNILGLERDLSLLTNSPDRFIQDIVNLTSTRIGKNFMPLINIRLETVGGKQVCAIAVKKSTNPAFLDGQKGVEFYIRTGNASRSLNVQELYHHLQAQF